MKRLLILVALSLVAVVGFLPTPVSALSLKVAPVEYRTELGKAEKKKGFIDISNPTAQTVRVSAAAEAFSQVDDNGTLRFYPDEFISAGIQLDLTEFEIQPRQAIRMYFLLDGAKLPTGDVFAAILFTLDPKLPSAGVAQTIRLGTLLSITNGTPGARDATVSSLSVPFLTVGSTIEGSYRIKNDAKIGTATGFYPKVKLSVKPFGESKNQTGKLIFAERSRQNTFSLKTPPFGFFQVKVAYQDSVRTKWVFVVHPLVLVLLAAVALVCGTAWKLVWHRRRK